MLQLNQLSATPDSGNITEKVAERMEKPENGEGCEMLSSEQDMAIAHIDSQQLCLYAQDLYTIKTAKSSSMHRNMAAEALPLAAGLLQVDSC